MFKFSQFLFLCQCEWKAILSSYDQPNLHNTGFTLEPFALFIKNGASKHTYCIYRYIQLLYVLTILEV